jgi:Putative porin
MKTTARVAICLPLISMLATPVMAADKEGSWVDRVSFYANLRLRYEDLQEEGNPDANRDRERGMVRFGVKADVHNKVMLVIGLASGGDNPVSRNVTGDGGFTTKDIGLELFYVDWEATESISVYAGKMKNQLFKAGKVPLIWDSDLNLEGIAGTYNSGMWFGSLSRYSVEERSGEDDSSLYSGQVGVVFDTGKTSKLTTGFGYFAYTNTIGNEPFYDGAANGNTVDVNGNLVFDYENTEAFLQFDARLGTWPLQLYGHYTVNNEVDREDTAYAFGATIGSTKEKGNMQFSWTYQDIEADSVIATFNDSDFGGGGTDSRGHMIKGKYMITDYINVAGAVFVNKIDGFQGGVERDFDRIQLDIQFLFE